MSSIAQAIQSAATLHGYTPSTPNPQSSGLPPVETQYSPQRNSMIRCPLPTLWNDSTDALRQFYMGGIVPQTRIMAPVQGVTNAGSSGGNAEVFQGGTGVAYNGPTISAGGSSAAPSQPAPVAAAQVSLTTPLLVPGAVFNGSIQVAPSLQLVTLSTNAACRVQMYGSRIAQLQDGSRALDAPPPAGVSPNIITDVALDTAPYQWGFQNRIAANTESPQTGTLYVTITNLGASSTAMTVTLHYVPLETA